MVSKVCSRSHGHPPGARSRAISATRSLKRSPEMLIDFQCKGAIVTCGAPKSRRRDAEAATEARRGLASASLALRIVAACDEFQGTVIPSEARKPPADVVSPGGLGIPRFARNDTPMLLAAARPRCALGVSPVN